MEWFGRRHRGGTVDPPGHLGTDGGNVCDECPHGHHQKLRHVAARLRKSLTYDREK
ncbi:MAG: hypothetical protein AB7L09_23980 [Nitrospira sp.]